MQAKAALRVGRHKSVIARAIEAWSGIDDFRLAKLAVALGLQRSNQLNFADVGAQAAFARGDIRAAYIAARKRQRSSPSDVWAGIEREFAAGLLRRERPHFGASPWSNLGRQLSIVLARAEEFEEASGELEEILQELRGPTFRCCVGRFQRIRCCLRGKSTIDANNGVSEFKKVGSRGFAPGERRVLSSGKR